MYTLIQGWGLICSAHSTLLTSLSFLLCQLFFVVSLLFLSISNTGATDSRKPPDVILFSGVC
ncbi:hypothetical protein SOVF_002980 [Spinacia oleracea]|nr:hypothetical protein SOVF_002980 [Spinacia oleracea]